MKLKQIYIPNYNFDLHLIEIESAIDKEQALIEFDWVGMSDEEIDLEVKHIEENYIDGGVTYRNFERKRFLVILFPMSSLELRLEALGHEKRHVEDRILQYYKDADIEDAGYLAGWLTKEMFVE